jgi:ADP-heptose:LPS heptosyltransferase
MKKILVIRFSSIGDIVLTSPVLRCLKDQLDCEIHFITKKANAIVLDANPHISKVITIEKEIDEVTKALKAEKYDFVVDLHHNLRSLRLRRALKRPSAAFPKLNRQKLLYTKFKRRNIMPDIHVVDRYFAATNSLGVLNDHKGLEYHIPDGCQIKLADRQIKDDFIAFAIGAQFATKRLPVNKMIELVKKSNKQMVLLGGPTDKQEADQIAKACPDVINLVGELSWHETASVIEQSSKVITHDTGMMHIAAAFNKPIAAIWGNTTPQLGMYPYMPSKEDLFENHQVELGCRPCSKIGYQKCPKKHFKCMNEQDLDAILSLPQVPTK